MKELIKFEIRKILRSKAFYILLAISIAFLIFTAATARLTNEALKKLGEPELPFSAYYFAKGAMSNSSMTLMLGIFVAIFVCEDFVGPIKNILGKGYSRTHVFLSKYLVSLATTIVWYVLVIVVALVYSSIAWGNNLPISDNIFVIFLGQFLGLIAIHSFYFAIAYGFTKLSTSIAVILLAPIGINLLLGLLDKAFNITVYKISGFWLDGVVANYTTSATNDKMLIWGFLLLAIYTAGSIALGLYFAKRKEV